MRDPGKARPPSVHREQNGFTQYPAWITESALQGDWFVYWLIDTDDEVFYVGSTGNLRQRLKTHWRNHPELVSAISLGPFSQSDSLRCEIECIQSIRPRKNVAGLEEFR